MIYHLDNATDKQKAIIRFEYLINKGVTVELTEKRKNRTIKQNSYLHLLLSYAAIEYGDTLSYIKEEFFKRTVNPDVFIFERVNNKNGEIRTDLKSTRDINSKELTLCIERFKDWCSKEWGLYLPSPNDLVYLDQIRNEIENNKQYL